MSEKITENEVVQALKDCSDYAYHYCGECGFKDGDLLKAAIDLINRKNAEIENLKDILYDADGVNLVNYWHQQCKIAENGCRNFEEENENLKAEIENLKKINESYAELEQGCYVTGYKKIRNETINEMEEKLYSASFVTDWTPAIGGGYIEIRHVTTAAVEDIARKMRE